MPRKKTNSKSSTKKPAPKTKGKVKKAAKKNGSEKTKNAKKSPSAAKASGGDPIRDALARLRKNLAQR